MKSLTVSSVTFHNGFAKVHYTDVSCLIAGIRDGSIIYREDELYFTEDYDPDCGYSYEFYNK